MLLVTNNVKSTGQGVYGFRAVKGDRIVWLNVGKVKSAKEHINDRVLSYIDERWFCANPDGLSVNAEFPFAVVVKAITAIGWTVEAIQLSEDHQDEVPLWKEKEPILQQREDNRKACFSERLLLRGQAPSNANRGWYANTNSVPLNELKAEAARLLSPTISDIVATYFS